MNKYFEIFWRFLVLGSISFGGPAAHIGYFRQTFVDKYKWLDNEAYARTVALSQFLPGPGSSQVGFSLGYQRAGVFGGFAAFLGFTFPSVLIMLTLALIGQQFADTITFKGAVYGLKLLAVVVVFDAIVTMAKAFCRRRLHQLIAVITAVLLTLYASSYLQISLLVIFAIFGYFFSAHSSAESVVKEQSSKGFNKISIIALIAFITLFVISPLLVKQGAIFDVFNNFYQAGSLVFGGGHVVLPLLEQSVAPSMSADQFLMGYAAAQAVPGPMFTLATFLGAQLSDTSPILMALVATGAIFLPGFLLIIAFHNAWQILSSNLKVTSAMMAVNASVVGLLVAAFYQPILISAIHSVIDVGCVVVGYALLKLARVPIVALVATFCTLGVLLIQVNF